MGELKENKGLFPERTIFQVFGGLMHDNTLLDDIDMPLDKMDFFDGKNRFYQIVFVSMYNLYMQGVKHIDLVTISGYLSNYPEQNKIFNDNNGIEYLKAAMEMTYPDGKNFEYYYTELRKYSLLRYYENKGLDTRFIFDTSVSEDKIADEYMKLENYSIQDIVGLVESSLVIEPNLNYCRNILTTEVQAGESALELIEQLREIPDVGMPLSNEGLNTIARGARTGCLFMRSAPSGGGKSRMLAGDACRFSVPYYWDEKNNDWVYTGLSEPTLYITTEMEYSEIQTLLFATVSKVDEDHILNGTYAPGEYERVIQAIQYIKESPLYIVHIPDFSIEDIKNIVKKYYSQFHITYFVFDYIFASPRLMVELNQKNHLGLKEHQVLLVFATELKALAQQFDIFIFTASQLNREAADAKYKDQTLLAGAVALCNKLDVGIISIRPNAAEKKKLETLIHKMIKMPMPDMGHWVYKVRRGKLTKIIVWSKSNFGTMTEEALFVTDFDMNLIDINFTQIESVEKGIQENSVLISKVKEEQEYESVDQEIDQDNEQEIRQDIKQVNTNRFDW